MAMARGTRRRAKRDEGLAALSGRFGGAIALEEVTALIKLYFAA